MLTSKDYNAIAAIVHETAKIPSKMDRHIILMGILADYMAQENPNFDRDKFITACYGDK